MECKTTGAMSADTRLLMLRLGLELGQPMMWELPLLHWHLLQLTP